MALDGSPLISHAPVRVPAPRSPAESVLRVALVHERFTDWAGSEKVVEQMADLWPDATIHASLCDWDSLPAQLSDRSISTSWLQKPFERVGHYEYLLPALPRAFGAMKLPADADLVVISHHAFANRVRVPEGIPVLSYVYSPARWMWDPSMLTVERGPWALRKGLGVWARRQRESDRVAAERSTSVVAISRHVQDRIARWWGLDSQVLHPPADTDFYTPGDVSREDFFLVAGRLVPYKRPDIAIRAALKAGRRIVVAGEGRMHDELVELAGDRVEFLGRVTDETLRDLYRRCAALIFPGEEDFGIVMAEAQACGAPVIARNIGGAVDIVRPGLTGLLYEPKNAGDAGEISALAEAMADFRHVAFDSSVIAQSALRFSRQNFQRGLERLAREAVSQGSKGVRNRRRPEPVGRSAAGS